MNMKSMITFQPRVALGLALLTVPSLPQAATKEPLLYAKANGITIAYESFGKPSKGTVLLIAGSGMQLTGWSPQFCSELVKRGFRVIVFDNRDIGFSTKFDRAGEPDIAAVVQAAVSKKPSPLPYTLYDMADDAVGLLDALRIKKAHIVGASMGGMIAQIVASNHPTRVASLTAMMSTDGKPGLPIFAKPTLLAKIPQRAAREDKQGYIDRMVKTWRVIQSPAFPTSRAELVSRVKEAVNRSYYPVGEYRQGAAALYTGLEDRRARLKEIAVPTMIVQGADDPITPLEAARDMKAIIPGAQLRIIPGMGHDLPPALVKTVVDAITSAASRARPKR
jgi:pimeloyl-ACP methyl ester carboxylesterase